MVTQRKYPGRPVVGVGGVVIDQARVLLVRRAAAPLRGQWSIPGGHLDLGETLVQGVVRELAEETGLEVRVQELIEAVERIEMPPRASGGRRRPPPRYHYIIFDYLCQRVSGTPRAASDAAELAWAGEEDLERFGMNEAAVRVVRKAFAMSRAR